MTATDIAYLLHVVSTCGFKTHSRFSRGTLESQLQHKPVMTRQPGFAMASHTGVCHEPLIVAALITGTTDQHVRPCSSGCNSLLKTPLDDQHDRSNPLAFGMPTGFSMGR